jgi:phosphoglycolate phosphatase-like HAD superfamily hydrolase
MINFSKYDCILWDFDGVLMDSMPIRDKGFESVLSKYPTEEISRLLDYHRQNGGLSRYVKFKYFFEVIRGESISEEGIQKLAKDFSVIMLELLTNKELLILETWSFIKNHYHEQDMYVVSGSDGRELNEICNQLSLAHYFKRIVGSPTPKKQLVQSILSQNSYKNVVLIGDSVNDLEAATTNSIDFVGYNNNRLKAIAPLYIDSFSI